MLIRKFNPRNINFLKNFRLRHKLSKVQRHLKARRAHVNSFILKRHVDSKLTALIGNARRILYGRHIFLCHFLSNLFYKAPTYVLGQGLISKTAGFQNLRHFFAKQQINSFLLARKDIRYLRTYGQIFSDLTNLLKGGYNFLSYPADRKNSLVNFFKLVSSTSGPFIDGTIKFVKFYPIFFRMSGTFMYADLFHKNIAAVVSKYEKMNFLTPLNSFALENSRDSLLLNRTVEDWSISAIPSFYRVSFLDKFFFLLQGFREKISISV